MPSPTSVEQVNSDPEQIFTLVEATELAPEPQFKVIHASEPASGRGLEIELTGGARLKVEDSSGIELAAELLALMNKH